jgi:hypothetical protein
MKQFRSPCVGQGLEIILSVAGKRETNRNRAISYIQEIPAADTWHAFYFGTGGLVIDHSSNVEHLLRSGQKISSVQGGRAEQKYGLTLKTAEHGCASRTGKRTITLIGNLLCELLDSFYSAAPLAREFP